MSDSQEEISTQPGLAVPPGSSPGGLQPGSLPALSGWPSVISSALLAGSNAVSAYIAYRLARPIAEVVPALLMAGRWKEALIAGSITAAIAAPLGLKYASRLVSAGTGLVGAIKGAIATRAGK
jgi:hypothetical protein